MVAFVALMLGWIALLRVMRDKLAEHKQYVTEYGQDLPEVRNWTWSH